jgi:hypothetical protein
MRWKANSSHSLPIDRAATATRSSRSFRRLYPESTHHSESSEVSSKGGYILLTGKYFRFFQRLPEKGRISGNT